MASSAQHPSPHPEPSRLESSRAESAESRIFAFLCRSGAALAVIAVVCGVVMLLLKAIGEQPTPLLAQALLILLPLAFLELMAALALGVRRRRRT